jgi:hypothetical protein
MVTHQEETFRRPTAILLDPRPWSCLVLLGFVRKLWSQAPSASRKNRNDYHPVPIRLQGLSRLPWPASNNKHKGRQNGNNPIRFLLQKRFKRY